MTFITQPTIGTHASDGFCQGPQFDANYGKIWPYAANAPVARGSFNSPIRVYDIQPQPASLTNICPLNPGLIGYLQLITVATGGNTPTSFANQFAVQTDVPRALQVQTETAGQTAVNIYFYGVDEDGFYITEELALPAANAIVVGKKSFAYVLRVYMDGNPNGNVSVGCADVFGLPYIAADRNYITPMWDGNLDNTLPLATVGATVALDDGVEFVPNPNVNAQSFIFGNINTAGTATGQISFPSEAIVPGVQFGIVSASATDTSTVDYKISRSSAAKGTFQFNGTSGTFTVINPLVTPTSLIFFTFNTLDATEANVGFLELAEQSSGSFTVTTTNVDDTSSVNYWVVNGPSLYAGTHTLIGGTATINNPSVVNVANGKSIVLVSRTIGGGTLGILGVPTVTNGASFVVQSYTLAAATDQVLDTSTFNWMLINPESEGIFNLPDATSPALINGGAVRGSYQPSTPSDGSKRLTVSMYVRGTDQVANFIGNATNNAALQSTEVNLYGVPNYFDLAH